MALSWNEIKTRANAFAKEWQDESREDAEAKTFWDGFFNVFGITRRRIASFEEPVKKSDNQGGFIDLLWRGQLLVEHKSRGKSLDKAFHQALEYFPGLKERDLPKYILVSDLAKFRLYNLETNEQIEFPLKALYQHVKLFGFIAGYQTQIIKPQDPINIKAAERMGKLHDALKAVGYEGHALELYLVRLLFCLFAEDTTIFEKRLFQDYIESKTAEDGSDLAHHLITLFYVLNTQADKRLKNLDEHLAAFPYVNGKLFEEPLPPAQFDAKMREALLDLCALDWSMISPAIFGSLFQSIMDADARRNLGAHYTSEENILKLIKPLFLDALWEEFEKIKNNKKLLGDFHKKLRTLTFFDPACGCGNFLVITHRELRTLELAVLRVLFGGGQQVLDVEQLIQINVDQFYGIEIEEFPAQIAQVALWLTDHQMNMRISEEFGNYFARIPLKSTPHIVHGNALQCDWAQVLAPEHCSFILGNPPFIGHQWRSKEQVADMASVWGVDGKFGRLDFVTCWHKKSTDFMKLNPKIKVGLVSTNSICQGEQVGTLWGWMLSQGVKIHFAHRTFSWSNEARGKAAVHCVIIGFGLQEAAEKTIYEYEDIKGEPHAVKANNINPYLIDAPDIVLPSRTAAPAGLPQLIKGSQPTDGGNLILTELEKAELIAAEPQAAQWIRPFIGGEELINGTVRYCLWLKEASPSQLKALPLVMQRIKAVAEWRLTSATASVRGYSAMPTLFTQDRQPISDYLALPRVSSERRSFIPISFLTSNTIAHEKLLIIQNAKLIHFGVLCSSMHKAWMRTVAGRLESRYSYAPAVYNNFPWPEPTDKQTQSIEVCAQSVLDARAAHPQR